MTIDLYYLDRFKADLLALEPEEVFNRYIVPDACMGLTTVDVRILRERIASRFETELSSVIIVGSAKLGFTLTPKKATGEDEEDRPVFSSFSENSVLRCLEWVETSSSGQLEVELAGQQIDDGLEVAA